MKVMKNRWMQSLLAIVMVLGVLAGCTSGASENTSGDSNTNSGSGEGISGKLEIQYFVGGYGDAWYKMVIDAFEKKYPDVTVKAYASSNINKEMAPRWIAGNPPDVVYIDGAGISEPQMVEDDQLMNLTEWVKSIKMPDGTSLMDSLIVPPSKYNGEIYSLPLVFDMWGTWYDKAWFEQEGFDVPTDFKSWMASMEEIQTKTGIAPLTTTGKYPVYFLEGVLYPAFASVGGNELLANLINGKEGAWTSDKVLGVMKKVQKMQEAGYIDPGFAAISHTQSQMNFLLHKNAYIPVGLWLPNEMAKDQPDEFKYGFIPTPMNPPGEPMVIIPNLKPIAIAKQADNPEAAKAFVKFVFQKKFAKKFVELSGALFNRKNMDISQNSKVPAYLKDINKMLNNPDKIAIHHTPHPIPADMESAITSALVALMLGEIDAEEFCQRAEAAAEKYRNSQ